LFGQHHVHWIESGLVDAGKIMIFNNGVNRPQGDFSTIEVITSPITASGDYLLNDAVAFEPTTSDWTYMADNPTDFYGMNISGAQRLSNGNTLICQGPNGAFFEINSANEIVWKYICPVGAQGNILIQGSNPTQNSVFRATLLVANFPGLSGQTLTPGAPIELNPLDYVCEMTNGVLEFSVSKNNYIAINPFDQCIQLMVESGMENAHISLHDHTGNKICEWYNQHAASSEKISLPIIQEIPSGMYYLRIQNSHDTAVIKLVHE
jgi:hypothetical protein